MKITQIETIIAPEHPHLMWVRIHTDEGIVGTGETTPRPTSARRIIHDTLAGMLLGRNPLDIEALWHEMFQAVNYHGYAGSEMRAISAVDIALWDILGKASNQPVYRLLGGRSRDAIPLYNTCVTHGMFTDRERFLEQPGRLASELLNDGFQGMKIWPFDEISVKSRGQSISLGDLEFGVHIIREIREAVAGEMEIALEGHACWNLPSAIRIARAVEPYNLMWLEDMIPADNTGALKQLRDSTSTPLCVSERLFTRHQFLPVMEQRAADIIMPDICWAGGISELMKIGTLASAYQLPVAPHNCGGPVQTAAYAHACTTLPNLMILESVRSFYHSYYEQLVDRIPRIEQGCLLVEDLPGLGICLSERLLQRTDLSREVSEGEPGGTPWTSGDPWKDDLGNQF